MKDLDDKYFLEAFSEPLDWPEKEEIPDLEGVFMPLNPPKKKIKKSKPSFDRHFILALNDFAPDYDFSPPLLKNLPESEPQVTQKNKTIYFYLKNNDGAAISRDISRKIKKGDLKVETTLNLRGMTEIEAFEKLNDFIYQEKSNSKRLLLIITGKGKPELGTGIIRSKMEQWLNIDKLRPLILYFTTASAQHGGEGAFYIYLRAH